MRRAEERDFHDFVVARSASLSRLARLLATDPHAGEDLLQSTLMKAWSAWPRVRQADDPDAYVRRVMVNTASKSRQRRWNREVPSSILPERSTPDGARAVDDRQVLVDAVRQLPARQRAAVVLRYFADLDDREVAQALGCSVATVRSQISRALATLRVQPAADSLRSREPS